MHSRQMDFACSITRVGSFTLIPIIQSNRKKPSKKNGARLGLNVLFFTCPLLENFLYRPLLLPYTPLQVSPIVQNDMGDYP